MLHFLLYFVIFLELGLCLWTKGVVHYAINSKDYDIHSQDIITGALSDVQREVCLKFFDTPPNYAPTVDNKVLYITNPDKRKNCPPDTYNYTGSVVDMAVGYKCITPRDVARITVDMLRASIQISAAKTVNSNDLVRKFQEQQEDLSRPTLLSPEDRNFINTHYHRECGALSVLPERRSAPVGDTLEDDMRMSRANEEYYKDKLWPLGVLMYGVEARLRNSEFHLRLKYAMATIELASCVVFQEVESDAELRTRSLLWFVSRGGEAPHLGFLAGNQSVSLASMAEGAPGHVAHALSMLLRALGLPMQSNRHDRDYYVTVTWNNVLKGKEHYLERAPAAAWLSDSLFPYDFYSAAHAPANYMCRACSHGETTLQPAQDHLWQRTLAMGHRAELSEGDKAMLYVLYSKPCRDRYAAHD